MKRFPVTSGLLVAGASAAFLAGCAVDVDLGDTSRRTENDVVPAEDVRQLVVDSENGLVEIRGGDAETISIEAIIDETEFGDGSHEIERNGDQLLVTGRCDDRWLTSCSVGFRIVVPKSLDVNVRTDNGRIELASVAGGVDVATDNGRIVGNAIDASRVRARTDNGRVELAFTAAPQVVEVRTDNGRIELELPDADSGYDIDATTDNGDVDVEVRNDPASPRTVTASSDNGSVTITAPVNVRSGGGTGS